MNNLNYNYLSSDVIASRILKHPLMKDMNYEDIISHIVDVLRLVNVPRAYEENSCYRNIVDFKAALPSDRLNIKSVDLIISGYPTPMVLATDTKSTQIDKIKYPVFSGRYTYTPNADRLHTNCETGMVFVVI